MAQINKEFVVKTIKERCSRRSIPSLSMDFLNKLVSNHYSNGWQRVFIGMETLRYANGDTRILLCRRYKRFMVMNYSRAAIYEADYYVKVNLDMFLYKFMRDAYKGLITRQGGKRSWLGAFIKIYPMARRYPYDPELRHLQCRLHENILSFLQTSDRLLEVSTIGKFKANLETWMRTADREQYEEWQHCVTR